MKILTQKVWDRLESLNFESSQVVLMLQVHEPQFQVQGFRQAYKSCYSLYDQCKENSRSVFWGILFFFFLVFEVFFFSKHYNFILTDSDQTGDCNGDYLPSNSQPWAAGIFIQVRKFSCLPFVITINHYINDSSLLLYPDS